MVPKKDGTLRVCGAYKVTINRYIQPEPYPLPNTEDLLATLPGGKYFIKGELSNAYQQFEWEEDSKAYTSVPTHKGVYCYNRPSFGASTVPWISQKIVDQVLGGAYNVVCYLDDILIMYKTLDERAALLDRVLTRLSHYDIRVRLPKCAFLQTNVEYLGYIINEE